MNSLEIYSEIFIGFVGFSGVLAALGVRNDSVWSVVDKNRFIILIFASFSGVFSLSFLRLFSITLWIKRPVGN